MTAHLFREEGRLVITLEFWRQEPLLYTPDRAYRRITGEERDRDTRYSYESCSNTQGWAD
ncbi:hypothetical protein ACWCO9_24920 [Streptomyces sp. NPDC001937]